MDAYTFDALAKAIQRTSHQPSGTKLAVSERPNPFVPPTFDAGSEKSALSVEVILVRAPAAVGKSTLAHGLSAERNIPVLDLSKTAVATGSLKGILADLRNGEDPILAFHAGELPLIIDALDEGRVRSGENGFISFLETSAATVAEDRSATDRPKLILFGRPEAIQWAELAFDEAQVASQIIDVGYFSRDSARELIHAYARANAAEDSLYHVHSEPVEKLIDAYFNKIEAALGLSEGTLWDAESGKSFAGYAPVLSTLGRLLPEIDNYQDALNKLEQTGTRDAWGVIETVLDAITSREAAKLETLTVGSLSNALPAEAYDKDEQLALLLQYVQGESLSGTGRTNLAHGDQAKYDDAIVRWLPEHPFLKNGKFSNDVIASYVYAPAIANDRRLKSAQDLLLLARQPFFWRSLSTLLNDTSLVDGKYLGYILNSFWNDPLTKLHHVRISDGVSEGSSQITMTWSGGKLTFGVTAPLHYYGLTRNAEIMTSEEMRLNGVGDVSTRIFLIDNCVISSDGDVELAADKLQITGDTWLNARIAVTANQLALEVDKHAKVGWGESLATVYPFSRYQSTLADPTGNAEVDPVLAMLAECEQRFKTGAVLTLNPDLTAPHGDPHTQWTLRAYPKAFPELLRQMIAHGYAEQGTMPASGSGKVRVRVQKDFGELRNLVEDNAPEIRELAEAVRREI